MNDQGLADRLGGARMAAKTLSLPLQVAFAAVIIQPGLPYGHHLGVLRQAREGLHAEFRFPLGVRMRAHRGGNAFKIMGDLQDLGKSGAVHRNAQHSLHPGGPGRVDHGGGPAFGFYHGKVAVGIDKGGLEHQGAPQWRRGAAFRFCQRATSSSSRVCRFRAPVLASR